MSFPKYAEYVDSGVEWLEEVPIHWKTDKFRYVFNESNEKIEKTVIGEMLSVSGYRGIEIKAYDDDNKRRTEDELYGYRVVRPGQLVVNTMWLNYSGLGVSSHEGHVSPAYRSYWIKFDVDKRYIHHLMRSSTYVQGYTQLLTGIRPNSLQMSRDDLMGFPILLPPKTEQTQIARFLDHETAKIDALIAEQKRLIKLLQEKLHSLILSDIKNHNLPEERLQHLVDVVRRPVTQLPDEDYVALGLFNRGRGLFHKPAKKRDEMGDSDFFWIKQGDLIISGQFAWEGAVAMATELETGKVVSHRYPVIRGRRGGILTEYLFALLTTSHGDFLLNENSRGAAGRNRPLNLNSLLKEKVKIPSISKQELVANLVHRVNQIKLETQMQKELLLERRSTLISAVVTGKIDVRGWLPPSDESASDEEVQKVGLEASE